MIKIRGDISNKIRIREWLLFTTDLIFSYQRVQNSSTSTRGVDLCESPTNAKKCINIAQKIIAQIPKKRKPPFIIIIRIPNNELSRIAKPFSSTANTPQSPINNFTTSKTKSNSQIRKRTASVGFMRARILQKIFNNQIIIK